MEKILVFGGTYFVGYEISKALLDKGYDVTLLNRGTKKHDLQVNEIHVDRRNKDLLKSKLINENFDYVVDVSALNKEDVSNSYEAVKHMKLKNYVFISSSAVYEPSGVIPIKEEFSRGNNPFWGQYGIDKIEAENYLREKFEKENFSFVSIRPPYIYGQGNYVYRESYVFDRVAMKRPVVIPKGNTLIQFSHVEDVANAVVTLLKHPTGEHYNIGDSYGITFRSWVEECIKVTGEKCEIIEFDNEKHGYNSRDFFPFYDYQYVLDSEKLGEIYKSKISLDEGLKKAFNWYGKNKESIVKKPQLLITEDKIMENLRINEVK